MATKLTTEQFALHICNIINEDIEKKQFTDNWYVDLGIIKNDLPHDFNPNVFLNIIKNTFNFSDIQIEDWDYKLRLIGRFIVKKPILSIGSVADEFMKQAYSEAEEQLIILKAIQVPNISKGNGK